MMLTWQIIRKDLARLILPLSLWVLFVVGTTVGFGLWLAPEGTGEISNWIEGVNGGGIAMVLLQSTVGTLLAAVMLLEDRPGGATAFWLTRPMSGTRMLVAKILGGVFGIAVIPAMALALCWVGLGFSLRETIWAAVEHLVWQTVLVVPALAVMAQGGGLGRFALVAMASWLVVMFTVIAIDTPSVRFLLHPQWVSTQGATMVGVLALGAALVLITAYRRHRVLPSVLWGVTLALLIVLRTTTGEVITGARVQPSPELEGVRWEQVRGDGGNQVVTLLTPGPDAAGRWLAPLAARVQATPAGKTYELERASAWAEVAARRLVGMERGSGPLTWSLALGGELAGQLRENPTMGAGEVRLAKMQARVLWEMPLRVEAAVRHGSSFARMLSLGWVDNFARRRIVLQERDARLAMEEGVGLNLGERAMRRRDDARVDAFLLVNRTRGYARVLGLQELGTARMNSLLLTARALEIEPAAAIGPALNAWEEEAVVIKVRFTTLEAAVHGLPGGTVTAMKETNP